jgi:putative sigma-54 modulation protein
MMIQGIHLEITPSIDQYLRDKLGKSISHVDAREIREIDVRCSARGGEDSRGGDEHRTEVTVLMTNKSSMHADEAGDNLYATIDSCADKITRAMRKHKEKSSAKGERHGKHAGSAKDAIYAEAMGASSEDDDVPAAA